MRQRRRKVRDAERVEIRRHEWRRHGKWCRLIVQERILTDNYPMEGKREETDVRRSLRKRSTNCPKGSVSDLRQPRHLHDGLFSFFSPLLPSSVKPLALCAPLIVKLFAHWSHRESNRYKQWISHHSTQRCRGHQESTRTGECVTSCVCTTKWINNDVDDDTCYSVVVQTSGQP